VSRRLIALALVAAGGAAQARSTAVDPAAADPTAADPAAVDPAAADPAVADPAVADPAAADPAAADPAVADPAVADPAVADPAATAPASDPGSAAAAPDAGADALGDQAISATLGVATGGRVTPGGLRIAGHYLYQLSDRDWFDGAASFTFGSGRAACFRDRSDAVVCDHGLADGVGVELSASVRRVFAPQGAFLPFAALGVGLGGVRFSSDDVSGIAVPLHAGGGVRVAISPAVAVVAEGTLSLGLGSFGRGLGTQPQAGLAITAGAEFRLR
jgi:opacity protein-like surface antigen